MLAAGLGKRMGLMTQSCPKPLLQVAGESLIERHIKRLKKCGFTDLIINVSYLGKKIEAQLGNGADLGVNIIYSREPEPQETLGGLRWARKYLGDAPILVVSSDIISDYPYEILGQTWEKNLNLCPDLAAHLVLVPNPRFHLAGDFGLIESRVINLTEQSNEPMPTYTFGNISVINPCAFEQYDSSVDRLGVWFAHLAQQRQITGELYQGRWFNVGTPELLKEAENSLKQDVQ